MHWLDITILSMLAIGAIFGFWSGLLWQIARVISLALSIYLAIVSNSHVGDWLHEHWENTSLFVCRATAFVAVFLLVYIVLYLITNMLHKAIKATKLEMVDRLLGALLGAAKMGVIVSIVCACLTALALQTTQNWVDQSTLASPFARATSVMIGLIPQEYRHRFDENFHLARDQMQKKVADEVMPKQP